MAECIGSKHGNVDIDTVLGVLWHRRDDRLKGENTMALELTDLHNRRANILHVSQRCKENGFPLLAWPEDAELLRLTDLPILNGAINIPPTWQSASPTRTRFVTDDTELKSFIREGYSYYRNTTCQQFAQGRTLVVEVKFQY